MKKIIQISLLLFILLISNIGFAQQGPRPSYHQGFARSASESMYPNGWRGLVYCSEPSLGISGTTIKDWSRYRFPTSLASTSWVVANFKTPGLALEVGGSLYNGVTITDNGALGFEGASESFSVLIQLRPDVTNSHQGLVYKADANNDFWRVHLWNNNRVVCSLDNIDFSTGTSVFSAGSMYFVVCLFNKEGNGEIYINGVQDGTPVALSNETLALSASEFAIGHNPTETAQNFDGLIGSVRIYNRILLPAEIKYMYQHPLAMFQQQQPLPFRVPDGGGSEETQVIIISQFINRFNNFVGCLYN